MLEEYLEKNLWFAVPFNVVESAEFLQLTPADRVMYYTLCGLANHYGDKKTGWFFHSMNSIARASNLDKKTIVRAKKKLKTLNFIEVKRGKYHDNTKKRSADCYKINGLRMMD